MICKTYASEQEQQQEADKSFIAGLLAQHKYALINNKKYTNLEEIIKLRNSGNVVNFASATSEYYEEDAKIYLYVPFRYNIDVKKLDAKFDWKIKKWYVYKNHPNKQKLVDLYHDRNFIGDTIVGDDELITYEERNEEIECEILEEREKYEMREKWIKIHGNDDKFDDYYFTI
jgi:hypothetical protein